MLKSRLGLALCAGLFIVLSAPYSQVAFEAASRTWPGQFRAIAISATALPVAVALLVAILRIRDRHAIRYAALALGLGAGAAFILLGEVGFVEAFHFVEYGLLAILFYRACVTFDGAASVAVPLLACVIVGVIDEWFQWFIPVRTGEARDVLLNVVASGCGLLLALAVHPPRHLTLSLDRRSRIVTLATAAACAMVFGAFVWTLREGYEIRDAEIGSFASRYSREYLDAASRDRSERWRRDPPLVIRRLSREDQYLAEGLSHVRRRNAAWSAGDIQSAWRENRILERFFEPVLDTHTYASANGNRWPEEQRADAASRAAGAVGGP